MEGREAGAAPQVSVIIVLYNSGAVIDRVLEALATQSFRDFELVLVDNASPQREIERLTIPANARVIRTGANLGFAGGNNRAAETCRGAYLCLLNPDAIPAPDWLAELVASAARTGAAATGSLQVMDDMPERLDGVGDVCHVSGLAWRGAFGHNVAEAPDRDCEIFSPCAAAALYDREAFVALGGFYERFFCYYEDVDLGFRLRLAGHRAVLAPRAVVRHVGSVTSGGRHSDFAVYHGLRNLIWGFAKNMPARLLPLAIPAHMMMLSLLLLKNVLRGSGRPAARGVWHGLCGVRDSLRDRRATQTAARPGYDLFLECGPLAPFRRSAKVRPLRSDSEPR